MYTMPRSCQRIPSRPTTACYRDNQTITNNKQNSNIYPPQLEKTLLGRPAIKALNLVTVHPSLHDPQQAYGAKCEIPKLFSGVGKFGGGYNILKPNAEPYSIPTPCRIPLPLMKESEELRRREEMEVISKVETHTE